MMIEIILDALKEAFVESWISFPILFILYSVLEWRGHTKGFNFFHEMNNIEIKKNIYKGPIIGALLGLIPQCGIGVLMTGLYLRGIISTGTILAIYISTSDEALLVIFSSVQNAFYIVPIMIIKFITASLFGIIIDKFFRIPPPELKERYKQRVESIPVKIEPHHSAGKHDWHPIKYAKIYWHAFKHAFNIYVYILIISTALYSIFAFINTDSIPAILSKYQFFEIIISTIIGLIPNCVASVFIAQAFLYSSLSLGAVIAGLSAAAGIGLIVLFKEAKFKTAFRIIIALVLFSIITGNIINSVYTLRLAPSKIKHIEQLHEH